MANGMLSSAVWLSHSVSAPGAAWELVTLRMVKYAANRAAKNINSEASQMIVPTATMSGRPSRPRSRDCGMGCRALAGLVIDPETAWVCRATRSLCRQRLRGSPQVATLFR